MESQTQEQIVISQNAEGYRYSIEPFLLAHWVRPSEGSRILDVGTGCGIIPLLLLGRQTNLQIKAVEIQNSLYQSAVENVKSNGWSDQIQIFEGDFRTIAEEWEPETFDWILSNPPYRKANSGKINPCPGKAIARHELSLTLETLTTVSAPLLKPGGKIALAYPFHRLEEVMNQLRKIQLNPTRFVRVFGNEKAAPKICIVEAVKGDAPRIPLEETLTLYHADGSYTQTLQDIYASFNHPGRSHSLR